ncbi:MAG TPA: histidine--tRNA ligase [Actinomycetota bacterium]|nr:histidine--tRNA ligase [Actinomycetota bacterium]
MNRIQRPKGTTDTIPPHSRQIERVVERALTEFRLYGYHRIDTPVYEHTDLFERGLDEGSDIVTKEMYTFEDKGGRSVTLRPDMTAPVMRAVLENGMDKGSLPLKLYYHVPVFRHEKPQSGRFRQFWQVGVEALGPSGPSIDAEVVKLASDSILAAGVPDAVLRLNTIGHPECREAYIPRLRAFLENHRSELCEDCARKIDRNPLRTFDCKVESDRALMENAPLITEFICDECRSHFEDLKAMLDSLSVPFELDPTLVRGLDYYSRTTFEFVSPRLGAQSSVGAGGRYDYLGELIGGVSLPGVGFGLGIERLLMAADLREPAPVRELVFVVATAGLRRDALKLAARLRSQGIPSDVDHMERSVKAQFRSAARAGATKVIVMGEREAAVGRFTVKDMASGEEVEVGADHLMTALAPQ